jgi:hypothetical protein
MKRTTVLLPDGLDARIRRDARRRGVSIEPRASQPPAFTAVGEVGLRNASGRVDELFGEAIATRRDRNTHR